MFHMNFPEGFFRTTQEVFEEVASYPIVPGEKLWQYWNVYTTTYRRGNDPTASRLESFWWHVMGSDRRLLSGKTLAKMYEEISTGPTFTPLRRPSNRFHTPVLPRITQTEPDDTGNGMNAQTEVTQGPVRIDIPSKPTVDTRAPKDMASSSSRPPPPHPILKKSRGPSTSGPRPTARFVSPHESEDETAKEDDESSGSLAATGLQMRRPAKSPVKGEKKSTPTGRKFTASSASKRHVRPVLARRPSSQSSADTIAKSTTPSSAGSSKTSAGGKSLSVEQSIPTSLGSSSNSALGKSPALSAKAAGKRPVRAAPQEKEKVENTNRGSTSGMPSRTPPVIVQHQPEAVTAQATSMERSRSHESRGTAEKPRSLLGPNPRGGQAAAAAAAPMMARSRSNIEHGPQSRPPREPHAPRPLPPSMITPKSTPVIKKVADVAVQVQFESESVTTAQGSGGSAAKDLPDSITLASRPSTSSLYTPTQPSPTPAPFLGRSRSQLTLLLEKMDQGKGGKGHRDHP